MHANARTRTHVRNCVCVFACKQTQTHADTSACTYICTRTQFVQTNGLTTRTRVYIINAGNAMPKPYLYTYVHAYARTYAHAVDREQYSQTHARKRTQINARKLIVAFDAWAISACKRVCILRVRSKTFRMYYIYRFPHTTYPYSSCVCFFLQQHPYSLFIFLVYIHVHHMHKAGVPSLGMRLILRSHYRTVPWNSSGTVPGTVLRRVHTTITTLPRINNYYYLTT